MIPSFIAFGGSDFPIRHAETIYRDRILGCCVNLFRRVGTICFEVCAIGATARIIVTMVLEKPGPNVANPNSSPSQKAAE